MNTQEIYINLDDSGKLIKKEHISVYGGIVFFSKSDRVKYLKSYKKMINEIKCNYCNQRKEKCNNNCPEIKNTNIKPSHKRRIMNYNRRYYTIAVIIKNDNIYDTIISNAASRGRFTDYAIKMLIKELMKNLIRKKIINDNFPLKIVLDIDQQSTKSNGYYNLKDSLIEELKYGINNFNYGTSIKPIIKNKLEIILTFRDSKTFYTIQAADIIAGTVRKAAIVAYNNQESISQKLDFINFKLILPKKRDQYN